MFWIIVLCVLGVGLVTGIVLLKSDNFDVTSNGELMTVIFGVAFGISALIAPVVYMGSRSAVNQFKQQSAYIQSHIPKNAVEDAALTNKKIELNTWLYNAQYQYENYRFFNTYPAEIADLQPIE